MPYLDRHKEIKQSKGTCLPHWHQDSKLQFVTFRLADSLPQAKVGELIDVRRNFYGQHPLPWSDNVKAEYRHIISLTTEKLLDNGFGKCLLANPDVRKILVDILNFNDDKTYKLVAYVIMPNHVHILFRPLEHNKTSKIIQSIKRNSSYTINRKLMTGGTVWQKGCFDRLVRDKKHLERCITYIRANPMFLLPQSYTLYVWPEWDETF